MVHSVKRPNWRRRTFGNIVAQALAIVGSPGQFTVASAGSFAPSTTGGATPYAFSLSGSLPPGLSFSNSTGAITGTPTTAGTFSGLSITVTDAKGATAVRGPFSLSVAAAGSSLTISGTPANANVGDSPSFAPSIAGGTPGYTLSVSAGSLPPGRSISGLAVVGAYTTAGSFSYTLRATDSLGATADLPVSLTVATAATVPAAPSIAPTAGNAQVSLAWVDGSTGGAAITSHNIYRGTSPGALALVGTIPAASPSPFVDTGLVNGQIYYYALSAVNSIGESAQSGVQSATPNASGPDLSSYSFMAGRLNNYIRTTMAALKNYVSAA